MKLATNASAGAASSSAAAPSCRICPATITPTRSASAAASSKSCVTSSVGSRSSPSSSASSPRTTARVCASSADSGSSSSSTAGSRASARASATRCLSPPERSAGRACARCEIRKRSSSSSTRSRPPKATLRRTSRCGKRAYSWKTSPTERRSGGRSIPASVSSQARAPSAILPRSGRSRPAIARSTLDFPAPDGPTSASVSRPSVAATESRKERRGWSRVRSSVSIWARA